jgi:hypothetical protein
VKFLHANDVLRDEIIEQRSNRYSGRKKYNNDQGEKKARASTHHACWFVLMTRTKIEHTDIGHRLYGTV